MDLPLFGIFFVGEKRINSVPDSPLAPIQMLLGRKGSGVRWHATPLTEALSKRLRPVYPPHLGSADFSKESCLSLFQDLAEFHEVFDLEDRPGRFRSSIGRFPESLRLVFARMDECITLDGLYFTKNALSRFRNLRLWAPESVPSGVTVLREVPLIGPGAPEFVSLEDVMEELSLEPPPPSWAYLTESRSTFQTDLF